MQERYITIEFHKYSFDKENNKISILDSGVEKKNGAIDFHGNKMQSLGEWIVSQLLAFTLALG